MKTQLWCIILSIILPYIQGLELQVITVATEETDGFKRFAKSAEYFNISVEVVGMGMEWRGGDIQRYPGGGFKINLLKPVLEKWKDRKDMVVMFVDSYDVIFASGAEEILQKFSDFNSNIVFSAEPYCWPDKSLATKYPRVGLGKRFLCSGGYIGYAADIYSLMTDHDIADTDDDQLYYTLIYLDEGKRTKYGMRLDHRSYIFQNLNGAEDEVDIKVTHNETYVLNNLYNTRSSVYHGNGGSKVFLSWLGNYIPNEWSETKGCVHCAANSKKLPDERSNWPQILLGVFVEKPTPFLSSMLAKLTNLNYPREKIDLFVHTMGDYHDKQLKEWTSKVASLYKSVEYVGFEDNVQEVEARQRAMVKCVEMECDYYFSVDSVTMFDNVNTLKQLITLNKSVVAPMMTRHKKMWSNFWGAVASDGFYARSRDYYDIVEGKKHGVWNVPHISSAILFQGDWIQRNKANLPSYMSQYYDPDMAFSSWMRNHGHFMYVSNLYDYGHLISTDNYETHHLNNDLYNIFENRLDWEAKYLHDNYSTNLMAEYEIEQPCPDVYWFPVLSPAYAKEMIEELENFGQWSGGGHKDERIAGGYENVPTRDIHMNQIEFEKQWLDMLRTYFVPVQGRVFPGYYSHGNAIMNFMVKYHPEGQKDLRPHHDSSTWTLNIAMSTPGVDYEGGGCRFVRQNCSVVSTRLGWALMHPGRLTHYHEGLPVTQGTRYIMVSFVDP